MTFLRRVPAPCGVSRRRGPAGLWRRRPARLSDAHVWRCHGCTLPVLFPWWCSSSLLRSTCVHRMCCCGLACVFVLVAVVPQRNSACGAATGILCVFRSRSGVPLMSEAFACVTCADAVFPFTFLFLLLRYCSATLCSSHAIFRSLLHPTTPAPLPALVLCRVSRVAWPGKHHSTPQQTRIMCSRSNVTILIRRETASAEWCAVHGARHQGSALDRSTMAAYGAR